jgi:serine/threonine-protein kinase RsbW
MNFYNTVVNQISETKDFPVNASSLKEVRAFSRDVFEKIDLPQEQKDELVLAIAEAAQNIVKHGYKGVEETEDRMEIKISLKDSQLEIGFFDKGKTVVPENVQHRKLDDIKPGGLGTFFIKQIMDAAVFKKDQKGWVNHLVLTKKI